jgi:hypothetical protein
VFSATPVAIFVPLEEDEREERDDVVTFFFDPVEPDDPEEPDDPADSVVAPALASGVDGLCAWKARTAAVPTTVEEMTMGARLMIGDSSECE